MRANRASPEFPLSSNNRTEKYSDEHSLKRSLAGKVEYWTKNSSRWEPGVRCSASEMWARSGDPNGSNIPVWFLVGVSGACLVHFWLSRRL